MKFLLHVTCLPSRVFTIKFSSNFCNAFYYIVPGLEPSTLSMQISPVNIMAMSAAI